MSKLISVQNILNLLLIFVPIAIVLEYVVHARAEWIFVTACLAIIPLAGLMGKATEHLAERVGEGIGGLLNATFGNAAELIIAIMALRASSIGFSVRTAANVIMMPGSMAFRDPAPTAAAFPVSISALYKRPEGCSPKIIVAISTAGKSSCVPAGT